MSEEISLNLLADVFHLNPQYIGQLFKNEIGVNFLSYLTNIRMERAKKLLDRPSGQRGGAEIRLRGLPRVYKDLQKGWGRDAEPVPAGFLASLSDTFACKTCLSYRCIFR